MPIQEEWIVEYVLPGSTSHVLTQYFECQHQQTYSEADSCFDAEMVSNEAAPSSTGFGLPSA